MESTVARSSRASVESSFTMQAPRDGRTALAAQDRIRLQKMAGSGAAAAGRAKRHDARRDARWLPSRIGSRRDKSGRRRRGKEREQPDTRGWRRDREKRSGYFPRDFARGGRRRRQGAAQKAENLRSQRLKFRRGHRGTRVKNDVPSRWNLLLKPAQNLAKPPANSVAQHCAAKRPADAHAEAAALKAVRG